MKRRTVLAAGAAVFGAGAAAAIGYSVRDAVDPAPAPSGTPQARPSAVVAEAAARFRFSVATDPKRTLIHDQAGRLLATLTHGARTVALPGPVRAFTEPATTTARINSSTWVRIGPTAWDADAPLDTAWASWLFANIGSAEDDILAIALQYLHGSPVRRTAGVAVAGDAGFGYINNDTLRDGADFFDYLRIPWTFPDGERRRPSQRFDRDLDCSGYLRLVYGYRGGIALHRGNGIVDGLPRSAWAMADHAPAVTVASTRRPDQVPEDLSRLQPGDAVFFALHDEIPAVITHSGIYLGRDTTGGMRFVSSRGTADGPTFGDIAGDGVIDSGYFGDRLRRAIRF